VHALAQHDGDVLGALVEDDHVERLAGFGLDLDLFGFHGRRVCQNFRNWQQPMTSHSVRPRNSKGERLPQNTGAACGGMGLTSGDHSVYASTSTSSIEGPGSVSG
jgi:hypothetical protein